MSFHRFEVFINELFLRTAQKSKILFCISAWCTHCLASLFIVLCLSTSYITKIQGFVLDFAFLDVDKKFVVSLKSTANAKDVFLCAKLVDFCLHRHRRAEELTFSSNFSSVLLLHYLCDYLGNYMINICYRRIFLVLIIHNLSHTIDSSVVSYLLCIIPIKLCI